MTSIPAARAATSDVSVEVLKDFESTQRMGQVARRGRAAGDPLSEIQFNAQLQFLLTIGYLTVEQAAALFTWFHSSGMTKLPDLPGPDGLTGPTMYETLSTAIHFGTPTGVMDLINQGGFTDGTELAADILDFFSGLASAVGDLIGGALEGIDQTLMTATVLIQAASGLVHELHDLVVLAQ